MGSVSVVELNRNLSNLGLKHRNFARIAAVLDSNQDGKITCDEFVANMKEAGIVLESKTPTKRAVAREAAQAAKKKSKIPKAKEAFKAAARSSDEASTTCEQCKATVTSCLVM